MEIEEKSTVTLQTCRDKKYYKFADISRRKLEIIEHAKKYGKLSNLKEINPDAHVSADTIRKWRSTDPLFDQALIDLCGLKKKERLEVKRKDITDVYVDNKEKLDKLCSAVQRGVTLKGACGFAGIKMQQLQTLMEQDEAIYDRVTSAIHSFEVFANQKLQGHYDKDWRSIAWHLERRLPHDYSEIKNIRVERSQDCAEALPQVLSAEEQARLDEINRKISEIEEGV
jgi:hypothetical protein